MSLERDLQKAIRKGDVDGIKSVCSAIYDEYRRLLFHVSFEITGVAEEAEDASEEAFVSFFSRLEEAGNVKSIKYYLVSSARFISYKARRRMEGEPPADEEPESLDPDVPSSLDGIETLRRAKEIMTSEEADLVVKHLEYGLTFREISERRGVSEDSVSGKYKRAIDKLRKELKGGWK